eukprot:IDg5712t1
MQRSCMPFYAPKSGRICPLRAIMSCFPPRRRPADAASHASRYSRLSPAKTQRRRSRKRPGRHNVEQGSRSSLPYPEVDRQRRRHPQAEKSRSRQEAWAPPCFRRQRSLASSRCSASTLHHGVPLTRVDAADAFEMLVQKLPEERRARLSFKNGRPGRKFMRAFDRRHKASPAKLVSDHGIDAARLWNLDETGGAPGRDVGSSSRRRYMSRNGTGDALLAEFARTSRATMLPVVSAAGDAGPPLFVFKGSRAPFRNVLVNGAVYQQTYASMLPRGSVVAMREKVGGVDTTNFYNWALLFIESVRDLTANGRKVLLTYDAYRAHMSLPVLELFDRKGIVVYALPAHTSGKTQPCDVVLFAAFRAALTDAMIRLVQKDAARQLDMYDYCSILREAYHQAFTRDNIVASFRRSGLWPVDPSRLLAVPRPRDDVDLQTIVPPCELETLLDAKRDAVRRGILGVDVCVLSCGYLDTKRGAVLTSEAALAAARGKREQELRKREAKRLADARKELTAARRREKRKKAAEPEEEGKWRYRAEMHGLSVPEYKRTVRSMAQKRAIARLRCQ